MSGGAGAGLTTEELRAAVRSVLRDVLPAVAEAGADEAVPLNTAADLDAFVRRVATLCDDPGQRAALKDGSRRFRHAGAARQEVDRAVMRVERGAVTERTVQKAAAEGARLVIGPRAVLTPLARDRARSLGIEVEREER